MYRFTKEQDEWIKANYQSMPYKKLRAAFKERFGVDKDVRTRIRRMDLKKDNYFFTPEEDEWLIENFHKMTIPKLKEEFEKKFHRRSDVKKRVFKLNLRKDEYYFSEEEIAWLKENYPCDESREETYKRFIEKFGNKKTIGSIKQYCIKHHILKPKHRRNFQKGNVPWTTGISTEEWKKHYSPEALNKILNAYKQNLPNSRKRVEWEKKNGKIPEGYRLTDLGNGKLVLVNKKDARCLEFFKLLHKGELTETYLEIYEVKRKIKEVEGK